MNAGLIAFRMPHFDLVGVHLEAVQGVFYLGAVHVNCGQPSEYGVR